MTPDSLVDLTLREYDALRAEVLATVERQYSLANWGASSVAVIVAAVVAGWDTLTAIPGMMSVILAFIVPATMTVYVVSWSHVITKINQLGARLFEIEENVSKAVAPELIRQTFGLTPEEHFSPCKYTLGWEHKLWKGGVNARVHTTIWIVRLSLGVIYAAFILLNTLLLVHQQKSSLGEIWSATVAAGAFWIFIWFLVFRYLRLRTAE